MKKYLMTAAAAVALCGTFTSCSHEDITTGNGKIDVVDNYETTFISRFGQPYSEHNWGFGNVVKAASTRSVTINGDVYDTFTFPTTDELTAAFPTSIPSDADEVADLEKLYVGKQYTASWGTGTAWDMFAVYQNIIKKDHNLKITSIPSDGVIDVGHYQNGKDNLYNVYVKVNGNITIKRPQNAFFRLYILEGNVTLDSNFGEMAGVISIAEGATLNDPRDHIAANDGIKVYNRGTFNAIGTADYWNGSANVKYDIGNNASFYNEGSFYVKNGGMSYSAGAGNTSYFYNIGDDSYFEASSMMMNSTCNFISDGTVNISGETFVTQSGIVWVNNGHYTTGSMKFSAKNGTFYNYCQLIVKDLCTFTDGSFNMMANSYAEFGRGLFNNFHVVMHDNSGFNVKNDTKWGRQGAGIDQGFYAVDDNAKVYVRLAGTNHIPAHVGAAFHVQGANLTLAYKKIIFYDNLDQDENEWDKYVYSKPVTAKDLEDRKDGGITWDIHNVEKIYTGDDFSAVTVTKKENECSATWTTPGQEIVPEVATVKIIAEDLSVDEYGDFDFNDVVFLVDWVSETEAKITLQKAGGTLPLVIGVAAGQEEDADGNFHENEVHKRFNVSTGTMVNIGSKGVERNTVTFNVAGTFSKENFKADCNNIRVAVKKNGSWLELTAVRGRVPSKIAVTKSYEDCPERIDIESLHPDFPDWVQDPSVTWY